MSQALQREKFPHRGNSKVSVGVYEAKRSPIHCCLSRVERHGELAPVVAMVDVLRVLLCTFLVVAVLVSVILLAVMNRHGVVTMLCVLCVVLAMVCSLGVLWTLHGPCKDS